MTLIFNQMEKNLLYSNKFNASVTIINCNKFNKIALIKLKPDYPSDFDYYYFVLLKALKNQLS